MLDVASEPELVDRLRPGIDGLILEEGRRRATYLPQVWTQPLWSMLHIGALRIEVGLQLDFVAAVLLLLLSLLTLVALRSSRLLRPALLLLGLSAAVLLVDNLACVWLLWLLQTLLVARFTPAWPALLLRRVSELLLFLCIALLFWGLGWCCACPPAWACWNRWAWRC